MGSTQSDSENGEYIWERLYKGLAISTARTICISIRFSPENEELRFFASF
jgi:hypothetical protein